MTNLVSDFARVDDDNNVFLVIDNQERKIGQYPNVPAAEALAYYQRKFLDLDAQVRILEQRFLKNVEVSLLKKAQQNLAKELAEPNVIGDVKNLQNRVSALSKKLAEISQVQKNEAEAATKQSIANREKIASRAEAIAATDLSKIQWKKTSQEMAKLFEEWQAEQKAHPKIPKSLSEPIWKRFSTARNKFETEKRAYFAKLTASTKASKVAKLELVKKAEKLASKPDSNAAEYRELLEDWKKTGKSVGKSDQDLWLQFKAYGDAIYAARKVKIEIENAELSKNLEAKLELLLEASKIDPTRDAKAAKTQLLSVQQKWEKIGKVPRDKVREIEDKLRAIETKVKAAEQELWRKTDPATKDRTDSVVGQLEQSIVKLETELAKATESKNDKAIKDAQEALEARKAWLKVVLATQ